MTPAQSLKAASIAAGIIDRTELNQFLAQCEEESGNFSMKSENMNYRAPRLRVVWPSRFKAMSEAAIQKYVMNPQALANNVYANRMGNGTEATGDGWKYRGRAHLQITGKSMYEIIGKIIGKDLVKTPDLLGTLSIAEQASIAYWKSQVRPAMIRKGLRYDNTNGVTLIVNAGLTNIANRIKIFKRLMAE